MGHGAHVPAVAAHAPTEPDTVEAYPAVHEHAAAVAEPPAHELPGLHEAPTADELPDAQYDPAAHVQGACRVCVRPTRAQTRSKTNGSARKQALTASAIPPTQNDPAGHVDGELLPAGQYDPAPAAQATLSAVLPAHVYPTGHVTPLEEVLACGQ